MDINREPKRTASTTYMLQANPSYDDDNILTGGPEYSQSLILNKNNDSLPLKNSTNKLDVSLKDIQFIIICIGPNNLTTIQIGWALPPDDDPALGEEFEYVVLGNRYYMERIGGVIIHKRPFEISHNNQSPTGFGDQNDKIVCTADFETKDISFYINGAIVGVIKFPKSFIYSDKPLVPVIGLSYASVELNFKNLNLNIQDLSQSYLTIQEYLQIYRSDWVWERGSLVDWNVLFTYGLPMDIDIIQNNQQENNNYCTFLLIIILFFVFCFVRFVLMDIMIYIHTITNCLNKFVYI